MAERNEQRIGVMYCCNDCGKFFSRKNLLNYHLRNVHKMDIERKKTILCPMCSNASLISYDGLRTHLNSLHNLPTEKLLLSFNTLQDFEKWKTFEERKEECLYKCHSSKKTRHGKKIFYVCRRSGKFVNSGKGIRSLKSQGSCRIGAHCPSTIEILITKTFVNVTYYKTHRGHGKDICHLRISNSLKKEIEEKLKGGHSKRSILEQIRKSATELNRDTLITHQDVGNIAAKLNLKNVKRTASANKSKSNSQEEECNNNSVVAEYNNNFSVVAEFDINDFVVAEYTIDSSGVEECRNIGLIVEEYPTNNFVVEEGQNNFVVEECTANNLVVEECAADNLVGEECAADNLVVEECTYSPAECPNTDSVVEECTYSPAECPNTDSVVEEYQESSNLEEIQEESNEQSIAKLNHLIEIFRSNELPEVAYNIMRKLMDQMLHVAEDSMEKCRYQLERKTKFPRKKKKKSESKKQPTSSKKRKTNNTAQKQVEQAPIIQTLIPQN